MEKNSLHQNFGTMDLETGKEGPDTRFIGGKDKDKYKYDGGEFNKDNDDEQGRKGQIRDLLDRGTLHISFSADSTSS